ncbi:MAG: hypothetical protein PWP28_1209 [Oceanotoga sp.]|jgi:hypothetical protein|uniref:cobalamin biosynthesis protein CobQ n=1 Tax=Oceanotoga sp. TaxID=2108366 RepID=UPI00264B9B5B|nr:cobalamin biosynthesis protein CobQ [Oceanotoga sp.]MDN5342334.1 hypothetical protein [Oceanotoga sp.]
MIEKYKNNIFIGMFGSGKTEIAINTSLKLREKFENVAIADIDTISPYFRTRDVISELKEKNIKVVTPPEKYMHADVPIIPPSVGGYITNPDYRLVIDVGGNDDGAVVLGSLNNFVKKADFALYFVINTNRPFTDTEEKIIKNIQNLSAKARLSVDYLVCNSNIMEETTQEIITNGENILKNVSEKLGIPVAFTVVEESIEKNIKTNYEKFILKRYMLKAWD